MHEAVWMARLKRSCCKIGIGASPASMCVHKKYGDSVWSQACLVTRNMVQMCCHKKWVQMCSHKKYGDSVWSQEIYMVQMCCHKSGANVLSQEI